MNFPIFKNENRQKLLLNKMLCIVLMLRCCAITMMMVGMLIKCAKTLNPNECDPREEKRKNRNMHTTSHMWHLAKMANLNLGRSYFTPWF
jgi:hypothetical protein